MRIEHIGDACLMLGDCMEAMREMPDKSIQVCVTSPPYYGLRDYGVDGQIGQEKTPEEYTQKLVDVFSEVRRVLRDDGTLWLNLGDSYAGGAKSGTKRPGSGRADGFVDDRAQRNRNGLGLVHGCKPKDLIGIPWRVAFALQSDGWYLRQDIIWAKPNPMPESVTDRCTKSHEYIFLLSKSAHYFYDNEAIKEPSVYPNDDRKSRSIKMPDGWDSGAGSHGSFHRMGREKGQKRYPTESVSGIREGSALYANRNRRDVWTIATSPYKAAHFATYPRELVQPCILAGSSEGDTVLDPFGGSGTTAAVALSLGRKAITCELNPDYAELIKDRIKSEIAYQQPRLFDEPRIKAVPQELGL